MKRLLLALLMAAGASGAEEIQMDLAPDWEFVADTVMGGVSTGGVETVTVDGRKATRLTGEVSLDNDGGFVQMAADLGTGGAPLDASAFDGVRITLRGNGAAYDIRLRTTALDRPWQSFQTEILAPAGWTTLELPWERFAAHRTDAAFDPAQLRRIGVLAVGREMTADISVADLALYRDTGN